MSRAAATLRDVQDFTPLVESSAGRSIASTGGRRVYKGVTIIKSGLGNRRDKNFYPAETLEAAVRAGRFNGLRAFADHQDAISEEAQPERTVRDMVGVYNKPRFVRENKGGRVVADLHLFRSSKWLADNIDDLIDLGQADKIGISINGRGSTVERQIPMEEADSPVSVNWVEEFTVLRSADVVTEAGAGGGFAQLLESARDTKETAMKRLTETQKNSIKAAVDANDLDKLQALLNECGCAEGKGKAVTEAKKKKKGGDGDAEDAIDHGDDEATEADADEPDANELDAAAEAIKDAADREAEEAGADDEDVEEPEEDSDDEDVEDADVEEAADPLKGKSAGKLVQGKGQKNVKGVGKGGGSFVKPMKQNTGQKGRKFGEAAADGEIDVDTLLAQNDRLLTENARLSTQLRIRTTTDRARNLLRESAIPAKLQPEILRLMVGKSEKEMQGIVEYHERLLEAAIDGFDVSDDGRVEGAGARFRESFGSRDTDPRQLLDGLGLPTKS